MSLITRIAMAILVAAGVVYVVQRFDVPLPPFLEKAEQIVVDAAGAPPPWTVEGYGWKYEVASIARTSSEWQFKTRPSLTLTAYVERTDAPLFGGTSMDYRVSDEGSGSVLEGVPFTAGVPEDPPLHQRTKLVHVVWDAQPRASKITVTLHDFFWRDGRDLIIRNMRSPSR